MSKRLRHIVLVTNLFPNPQEKTKGQFIYQLVEHLKNHVEVTVISPVPFFPRCKLLKNHAHYKFSKIPTYDKKNGYNVYYCRHLVLPKLGLLTPFFLLLPLLLKILKIKIKSKIDLINGHWLFPDGVTCSLVGKLLKIPTVLSARGCDVNLYLELIGRNTLIKNSLLRCNYITSVSNDLRKQLNRLDIPRSKIKVIPNGIDLKRFNIQDRKFCRSKLNSVTPSKIILFVGSLDEVKATHFLIISFARLCKHNIDCHLWIVGKGHLGNNLKILVNELGVQGKVTFFPPQNHNLIPIFMGASDVFCLPSIREGRPNVIMEALACGLPIVASKVGGIPELVEHGKNGYLFDVGNTEQLEKFLIKSLLRDWPSNEIRKSVSHLNWTDCAKSYISIFETAIAGPKQTIKK